MNQPVPKKTDNRANETHTLTALPGSKKYQAKLERQRAVLAEALQELYKLLEDYAPAWYTEQIHEKAEKALRMLGEFD